MKSRGFKLKTLSKGRLSVHGHLLKNLLINELQLYNNTAICSLENCGKESVIIPMQLFNKNIVLSYNLNYFTTYFDEHEAQHIK